MFLREFFGKAIDIDKKLGKNQDNQELKNTVFWYLIDHNLLHKDYFHPIASKIHKAHKKDNLDQEDMIREFQTMVSKGCREFYEEHKLPGHFEDNFDEAFIKEMCERLYHHYNEDVASGKHYKIGV